MATPIILDTDIGTDVDDAFALVMAINEPRIEVRAVTTVYGDVDLRARMAKKLLNLMGHSDIPVGAGQGEPLFDGKACYWGGWEGKGILEPINEGISYESKDAIKMVADILKSSPEKLTFVAIGPLTNLAILLQTYPEVMPKIKEVICMAGTLQPNDEEWNVQCDPEAAKIAFTSGLPIKLGTRHFVNKPLLTQEHRNALLSEKSQILDILVLLFDEFLSHKTRTYCRMYDPITLSMAFTTEFLPTRVQPFEILYEDHIIRLNKCEEDLPPSFSIAVPEAVHPDPFISYLLQILKK